jgi:hypothetical protein
MARAMNTDTVSTAATLPGGNRVIGLLLIFAAIITVHRLRLASAPLHDDICAYAVIGHEMMHGRQLYSDLWERKPPLLYITYSIAESVTGYGPDQIALLGIAASLGTLVPIYLIGESASGKRASGLISAAFWTLMNADLHLAASQPDPEVFINLFLASSFLALLRLSSIPRTPRGYFWQAILVGLLLSAATLYKHSAVLICLTLLVGHAAIPQNRPFSSRLWDSSLAGAIIGVVWAGMLGYFAAQGRGEAFIDVLFRQNFSYSGSVGSNLLQSLKFNRVAPPFMSWAIAPGMVLCALAISGLKNKKMIPDRQWLMLLAWAVGVWPAVAITGYRSPLYYQLWIPVGCIAGGWASAALLQQRQRIPQGLGVLLVTGVFAFLLIRQGSEMLLTPDEWIHRQFPTYNLGERNELGRELARVLKPDESFWEFGDDNSLYFFSKHSPPTGLLFIDPFLYGSKTKTYWTRLLRDLDRAQPALVVMSDNYTSLFSVNAPIVPWLSKNYVPWNTALGWPYHHLLVRHDSDLEKRLSTQMSIRRDQQ